MTAATRNTRAAAPLNTSLATSAAFRTFALVFAVVGPAIYVVCEMNNWPLFTYHPGTGRLNWGYALAVRGEGPAMYWYGWIANTLVGGIFLAGLATLLPARLAARIPLALAWGVPLAAVPLLVYALRYYWRW